MTWSTIERWDPLLLNLNSRVYCSHCCGWNDNHEPFKNECHGILKSYFNRNWPLPNFYNMININFIIMHNNIVPGLLRGACLDVLGKKNCWFFIELDSAWPNITRKWWILELFFPSYVSLFLLFFIFFFHFIISIVESTNEDKDGPFLTLSHSHAVFRLCLFSVLLLYILLLSLFVFPFNWFLKSWSAQIFAPKTMKWRSRVSIQIFVLRWWFVSLGIFVLEMMIRLFGWGFFLLFWSQYFKMMIPSPSRAW